ncbi:proline-rich family protein [Actinidia rufa]|uniref:Proline-rich family protein n=1 Tax=Actinidia rufa TaxID=165716 RepID=A0A7J0FAR9_9ERIC|nr:proline-rich family protein [Actinidia rufa]
MSYYNQQQPPSASLLRKVILQKGIRRTLTLHQGTLHKGIPRGTLLRATLHRGTLHNMPLSTPLNSNTNSNRAAAAVALKDEGLIVSSDQKI